jgi:hypothetical protein
LEDSYNDAEFDDTIKGLENLTTPKQKTFPNSSNESLSENNLINALPLTQSNVDSYSLVTNTDYKGITT